MNGKNTTVALLVGGLGLSAWATLALRFEHGGPISLAVADPSGSPAMNPATVYVCCLALAVGTVIYCVGLYRLVSGMFSGPIATPERQPSTEASGTPGTPATPAARRLRRAISKARRLEDTDRIPAPRRMPRRSPSHL